MASAIWTDDGQEAAIDLLDPSTRAGVSAGFFIGWGSGDTAAAVSDSALESENPEPRASASISQPQVDTIRYLGEITATTLRQVNEAGVFDAATAGTLWLRGTHATLNVETGDRVEYTFDLRLRDQNEA